MHRTILSTVLSLVYHVSTRELYKENLKDALHFLLCKYGTCSKEFVIYEARYAIFSVVLCSHKGINNVLRNSLHPFFKLAQIRKEKRKLIYQKGLQFTGSVQPSAFSISQFTHVGMERQANIRTNSFWKTISVNQVHAWFKNEKFYI